MKFADNFNELLTAFANEAVDFLVVGGYAVNFYGYDRTTNDLDIWINPIEANKTKITKALISLDYLETGGQQVMNLDFLEPCCFRLGEVPHTVDIFTHMAGIRYEDAVKEKIPFQTEGHVIISFISLKDLTINKMLTGRTKDKADIEELQKIISLKK